MPSFLSTLHGRLTGRPFAATDIEQSPQADLANILFHAFIFAAAAPAGPFHFVAVDRLLSARLRILMPSLAPQTLLFRGHSLPFLLGGGAKVPVAMENESRKWS